YGTIVHTTDGGITWSLQRIEPARTYRSVWMTDPLTAIAVGDSGMSVRTTDGGVSWVPLASGTRNTLYGIAFSDASTGTMVGHSGTILRTTSGGLPVGVERDPRAALPAGFDLEQNYPNPFNGTTLIRFSVGSPSRVTLAIYGMLGQRLATLVDEDFGAGSYRVAFEARNLASGVYFYRLSAGNFQVTQKLLLLR
ncbi:MAG: T9SS type A sorting domain-containing protein, partial [Proteobacteria bacterium]|nr:T9SS type A sorting domain-containing protein [Pseudomonadota bacterium]